jgi:hypothetical protein
VRTEGVVRIIRWAGHGERWTVPVGGGVGRVLSIGSQPVNMTGQAYHNVERPDSGPEWMLRLQTQFFFPKGG